jgi:hypothetical protein
MPGNSFKASSFYWRVSDGRRFSRAVEELFASLPDQHGILSGDSLIVWGRNLGFLDDEAFTTAWSKHAKEPFERGIIWRTAVLVWAARQARRREGGFVECGCYAGTSMRIVLDSVDLKDREVFLYDLFEHSSDMPHHSMPRHGPELYEEVKGRFAQDANVRVIRGAVPDSFDQGVPDKVAFAHIDMNHFAAEIAALDALEPRLVPGAVIVLDDFGQFPYVKQHLADVEWFKKRGAPILESPTGQGIVIW